MILQRLLPRSDQLAHDGYVQFGLVSEADGLITEIFVAPTKHFKVWLSDESHFRSIMQRHGILESSHLEFIDEYPRITVPLSSERSTLGNYGEFVEEFREEIEALDSSAK